MIILFLKRISLEYTLLKLQSLNYFLISVSFLFCQVLSWKLKKLKLIIKNLVKIEQSIPQLKMTKQYFSAFIAIILTRLLFLLPLLLYSTFILRKDPWIFSIFSSVSFFHLNFLFL